MLLPLTTQEAIQAGLTASEIACAIQIGQSLGQAEKQKQAADTVLEDANKGKDKSDKQQLLTDISQQATHPKGLRARLRQEAVNLRVR